MNKHIECSYLRGLGRRALFIAACIMAMEVASVRIGAAGNCPANGIITTCGCTTVPGKSYTLGNNLVLTGTKLAGTPCCITVGPGGGITGGGTTINLNGFSITDQTTFTNTTQGICGLTAPFVTVQNGSVIGFRAFGINLGPDCSVTGVTARSNHGAAPQAIGIQCGDDSFIANNRATANGTGGAASSTFLGGGIICGSNCKIAENVASDNVAGNGITCGNNCVVESNTANSNSSFVGILCNAQCNVLNNTTNSNFDGIFVGQGGTISGNTADSNINGGIDVEGTSIVGGLGRGGALIKGNTAANNGGIGIVVSDPNTSTNGCVDNVASCNLGLCTGGNTGGNGFSPQISACTSFGAGNLCNGTPC